MNWCVVQEDARAFDAASLKGALRLLSRYSEADAVKLSRDAYGVLLRGLSAEEAQVLQQALPGTRALAEAQLPKLCDPKFVRRLELKPDALLVYDPLGRGLPVPWSQVTLLAAGAIRHFQMNKSITEEIVETPDGPEIVREVRHKVDPNTRLVLDLFVADGAMRFQVEAENFMYGYTFTVPPAAELLEKFQRLVQLLGERAAGCTINRGIYHMKSGGAPLHYATRGFFFDESIWLLWKVAQTRGT